LRKTPCWRSNEVAARRQRRRGRARAPRWPGFVERRQTGSHVILRKAQRTVAVPMHRPVKPGTLSGLIALSGVSLEEFVAEL